TALPYFTLYARDLRSSGYRPADVLRVFALNLMLIPVNLGGVFLSIRQAWTKEKSPFGRTPKVQGRTAAPPRYLMAEALILGCGSWARSTSSVRDASGTLGLPLPMRPFSPMPSSVLSGFASAGLISRWPCRTACPVFSPGGLDRRDRSRPSRHWDRGEQHDRCQPPNRQRRGRRSAQRHDAARVAPAHRAVRATARKPRIDWAGTAPVAEAPDHHRAPGSSPRSVSRPGNGTHGTGRDHRRSADHGGASS